MAAFFSKDDNRGSVLLYVMVFGTLAFSLVVVAVSGYSFGEYKAAVHRGNRETALQIAEAGINYYRWHLAHSPTDYKDGTNHDGPYVHDYIDGSGVSIGSYSLVITPPSPTSSIVTVESTGWLSVQTSSQRIVRVSLGRAALTDYSFISNTDVWIGNNTSVHGPMHSNSGIRFDGVADAPITSAVATYICKPLHGEGCNNEEKPGVWGQGGPESYWSFPVPSEDFTGGTPSLTQIKDNAINGGLYFSSSGEQGWLLKFNNTGTVTASKVTATKCYKGDDLNGANNSWFCVDIKTEGSGTTYPLPANGSLYVDDITWIDGVVRGQATVGVGTGKSAIINDNITYYNGASGTDKFGIIADQDILIPHDSPDDLEVNAALFATNGSAKRYYYTGDHKDSLSIFGSVVSAGTMTWSWVSNGGATVSGYDDITLTYDSRLLSNPPGGFPVESETRLVSWEEVKN